MPRTSDDFQLGSVDVTPPLGGPSESVDIGIGTIVCRGLALTDLMHFFECGACGQMVDARDLSEVLSHEIADHQAPAPN